MRDTGIGTSLFLMATGAILAFAVHLHSTAININVIGAILIAIGALGFVLSFAILGDLSGWGARSHRHHDYVDDELTPPHEHRRVETTDVVYQEDEPRVKA